MHFKEFVVFKPESVNILKYGYSYLSEDNTLIFRYDNALDPQAKKFATYPGHKHTHKDKELLSALKPAFEQMLKEISKIIEIEK